MYMYIHINIDILMKRVHPTGWQGVMGKKVPLSEADRASLPKVVLRKSIPTQIPQLILRIGNGNGYVDGFVGELTSAKRLLTHFV